MQNNESKQHTFAQFLKEKGYYIVLSLCVIAVGISGYVFVSTIAKQNRAVKEETLSVPITITDTEKPQPSTPASSEAAAPEEHTAEASAPADTDPDDAVRRAAAKIVVQPISGAVLSPYAADCLTYNATTRDWRVHNGVDLAATPGQVVVAAKAGTVSAVYDDEYFGTTVVISHEDGYTTHYCNLTAMPTVSAGQEVAAGDIIGAVGHTALLENALEPHLHFEVYRDGSGVDPAEFLS